MAPYASRSEKNAVSSVRAIRRRTLASAPVEAVTQPWRHALCIGVLGALALGLMGELSQRENVPRGDDLIYQRMAEHPFAAHTYPFAFRIGLPTLVHLLPFSYTLSFRLLACVSAGAAAGFAFVLMCRLGAPRSLAAALATALAISPPMLIVALRDGRNTDALTVAFMMAATLLAVERRLRALALTLLIGTLFREAVLFVVPFAYAIWATRAWDKDAARDAILVGVLAFAAYVALHLALPSVGKDSVPGYGGSLIGQRLEVIESGVRTLPTELRRLFTVYGPLWVAAPLALAYSRFARRGLVLVACSLASMTFALDWGRMMLLSAPAFYPAGAQTLTRYPRWRTPALVIFGLLILGYAIYMDRSGVQHGIIDSPPPPYPVR
jgi:hypothetical protein